ncbi:hypothetical protein ABLE94_05780 [Gordonia sp. VNK1]|uniref:hypothetical protein n=1 Tax=Gordonia oleivorans TaxID=3156618 RepID=UPI0032B431A7
MAAPAPRQQLPFAVVMRGYDREQVADRLRRIDADMRVLAADRDAATANARELAAHLADARDEIEMLRREVDKLSVPPTTVQGMSERLSRMLQLASDEASEMRADAGAEAAETVSVARQEAAETQQNAATEADRILADARAKAAKIVGDADTYSADTRNEADKVLATATADAEQAARDRAARAAAMESEHESTMSAARDEAQRIVAKAQAESEELTLRTGQTLQRERESHDADLADQRARADQLAADIETTARDIAAERVARSRDLGTRTTAARDEILGELARIADRLAELPGQLSTEVDAELTTASADSDVELLNRRLSDAAQVHVGKHAS